MSSWQELGESQIPTLTTTQLHRIYQRTSQVVDTLDYDARMCQTIDYDKYSKAKEIRVLCWTELNKRNEVK